MSSTGYAAATRCASVTISTVASRTAAGLVTRQNEKMRTNGTSHGRPLECLTSSAQWSSSVALLPAPCSAPTGPWVPGREHLKIGLASAGSANPCPRIRPPRGRGRSRPARASFDLRACGARRSGTPKRTHVSSARARSSPSSSTMIPRRKPGSVALAGGTVAAAPAHARAGAGRCGDRQRVLRATRSRRARADPPSPPGDAARPARRGCRCTRARTEDLMPRSPRARSTNQLLGRPSQPAPPAPRTSPS